MATNLANDYVKQFTTWRNDLRVYWDAIRKNQELYEFYKREQEETESQVSLNTPFSIVESMVARANESSINITVRAKGENKLQDFESWVSATLKQIIEDPDVARYHGTFRKNKERFFRDFLTKGNAVASVEYCYKTSVVGGKKKILADNPYIKNRDLFSVIFNPSRTLADSDIYYLDSWVKYSDLVAYEQNDKTSSGYYKNLNKVKDLADAAGKLIDDPEQYNFVDNQKVTKKAEPIHIIERWEGSKYCVIADVSEKGQVIIREEDDPFKIGGHNLLIGMNYAVGSRPYAYGEIDAIYGTVRAQDTIINQNLDIVNRFLRPGILVDPTSGVDIDELIILLENGGVMYGKPNMVGEVQKQLPPAQAFTTIDVMQQAIERAARFSPYASGLPSQQTDKTQGTLGGIRSLQQAAEPNFQVKLDALQDQFAQPAARLMLQMVAGLMGQMDIRYGLLQGRSPQWIKATKGILSGAASIQELIDAEIITEEVAAPYITTMVQVPDSLGNPARQVIEIPGAREAKMFDIDWIVEVNLDSTSAQEKEQQTQAKQAWVTWAQSLGVQFDPIKTATEIGRDIGIEDPEDLYASQQMPPMGTDPMASAMGAPTGSGNIGADIAA